MDVRVDRRVDRRMDGWTNAQTANAATAVMLVVAPLSKYELN